MGYCKGNYLEHGNCLEDPLNPHVCIGDNCDYWYSAKTSQMCPQYTNCTRCGQVFDLEKQGVKTPARGVFCSQYCRDMNMGEEMLRLEMENEDLNQGPPYICANPHCDKVIDGARYWRDGKFFCAADCAQDFENLNFFRSDDEICVATGQDSLNDKEKCEKCGHKFQGASHLIHEDDAMLEVCDSCYFGHRPKPEISRAEQLAEEHWVYVEKAIQHAGGYWDDEDFEHLDEIEYHYVTAFKHGYKHGVEDAIKKAKEGK